MASEHMAHERDLEHRDRSASMEATTLREERRAAEERAKALERQLKRQLYEASAREARLKKQAAAAAIKAADAAPPTAPVAVRPAAPPARATAAASASASDGRWREQLGSLCFSGDIEAAHKSLAQQRELHRLQMNDAEARQRRAALAKALAESERRVGEAEAKAARLRGRWSEQRAQQVLRAEMDERRRMARMSEARAAAASEAARLAHLKADAEQRERCRTADGARSFVPGRSVLPRAPFTGVASDPAAHLKGIPRRVPPRPASRVVFRSSRSLDILAKSPGQVALEMPRC